MSVAALCRAAVRSLRVDGAGVIATSGLMAREPLFASDGLSAQLEELQFTTGEGPGGGGFRVRCADADPGPGVDVGALANFAPAAVTAGAQALFAVPLQAGAIQVGVLSTYRSQPGPLTAAQLADVLVLADIALQMVLDAAAGLSGSPDCRPAGRSVESARRGAPGGRDDLRAAGGGPRRGLCPAAGARLCQQRPAGRCGRRRSEPQVAPGPRSSFRPGSVTSPLAAKCGGALPVIPEVYSGEYGGDGG